jgi:hypothetical protein
MLDARGFGDVAHRGGRAMGSARRESAQILPHNLPPLRRFPPWPLGILSRPSASEQRQQWE